MGRQSTVQSGNTFLLNNADEAVKEPLVGNISVRPFGFQASSDGQQREYDSASCKSSYCPHDILNEEFTDLVHSRFFHGVSGGQQLLAFLG